MPPLSAPSPNLPVPTAPEAADAKTRERIAKTARDFEASMISSLLGEMFKGVEVSAPFGGGHGEDAFRSFLTEAIAKQMAGGGGLGLADDLTREMLKMQGLV